MSNNAYAYVNRVTVKPDHPGLKLKHEDKPMKCWAARHAPEGPGGLSFTSHALFCAIEETAAWLGPSAPSSNDVVVQTLTKMAAELDHFGMYSYWRLKAWMNYHSDAVREVSRLNQGVNNGGTGVGAAWLVTRECRFNVLARCYFEVVDMERERERKNRRKGFVMDNRNCVLP